MIVRGGLLVVVSYLQVRGGVCLPTSFPLPSTIPFPTIPSPLHSFSPFPPPSPTLSTIPTKPSLLLLKKPPLYHPNQTLPSTSSTSSSPFPPPPSLPPTPVPKTPSTPLVKSITPKTPQPPLFDPVTGAAAR